HLLPRREPLRDRAARPTPDHPPGGRHAEAGRQGGGQPARPGGDDRRRGGSGGRLALSRSLVGAVLEPALGGGTPPAPNRLTGARRAGLARLARGRFLGCSQTTLPNEGRPGKRLVVHPPRGRPRRGVVPPERRRPGAAQPGPQSIRPGDPGADASNAGPPDRGASPARALELSMSTSTANEYILISL